MPSALKMNTVYVWVIAISFVVTVPSILLVFFRFSPTPWRDTLYKYQSVVGSLVTLFAAGLALVGVLMTVSVQKENTDQQLGEQRAAEDRGRAIRRQQIASAFLAEIDLIEARFRTPDWRDTATKALDIVKNIQASGVSATFAVNAPTADYATFFRANVAEVGQFREPIPQNLLLFYGSYIALEENIKFLADAYTDNFKHMDAPTVKHLLEGQLTLIGSLQQYGAALIPELQKIVDERVQ
jgi:hypothetical protein